MGEFWKLTADSAANLGLILTLGLASRWLLALGPSRQPVVMALAAGALFGAAGGFGLAAPIALTTGASLHIGFLCVAVAATLAGPLAACVAVAVFSALAVGIGQPAFSTAGAVVSALVYGLWLRERWLTKGLLHTPARLLGAGAATVLVTLPWLIVESSPGALLLVTLAPYAMLFYAVGFLVLCLLAAPVAAKDAASFQVRPSEPAPSSDNPAVPAPTWVPEVHLFDIIDSLADGYAMFDADDRLVLWNARFRDLLGASGGELVPGIPFERLARRHVEAELAGLAQADQENWLANRLAQHRDLPSANIARHGGHWVRFEEQPTRSGGVSVTASDVTDMVEHEFRLAELAEHNAMLAEAISATSSGVVITDPNLPGNPIVFVNPAFSRITGYAAEEVFGKSCRLLQGQGTDPKMIERLNRAISAKRPVTLTIRNYRKDGRTFWNELSVNPIFDAADHLIRFVGVQTDVTDRMRAEEAVRASEKSVRDVAQIQSATLDALPAQVALLDAEGRVLSTNRAWAGDTDWIVPVGADYIEILEGLEGTGDGRMNGAAAELRGILRGDRESLQREYARPAGSSLRWFAFIARTVSTEDRRGAVVMHFDITDRIAAEAAVRVAKDHAEVASRSKSEFLANMSHELRTPLNAIIGFSEIMEKEMFGKIRQPQYRGYAKDIRESGVHLLSIINDILDLSKIEAGKLILHPTEIDVRDLVQSSLRFVREKAKIGGVKLKSDITRDPPPLYADERAVKQILINLLSNAVKFTEKGGGVTMRAHLDADENYVLAVADTGIGISKQDIDKALAPFSQIDSAITRKQGGTGLGLPLVRLLAELHGGSLKLESEPSVGTTAIVTLPNRRESLAA